VICGANTFAKIERNGIAKAEWLKGFLDLRHGIPSPDTYGRVFRRLDEEAFHRMFLA
jgi:hypothetical protein